jgi:hypothetical protein
MGNLVSISNIFTLNMVTYNLCLLFEAESVDSLIAQARSSG